MRQRTVQACIACGVALGAAFASFGASADVIRSPTSVISNSAGDYSATFSSSNMINQSGLSAGFTSGVTNFDTYIASNPTSTANDVNGWDSPSNPIYPITIGFDMGAVYSLSRLALWNDASGSTADTQNFKVYTASNAAFTGATLVGSFTNPQGVGGGGQDPATVFNLALTSARYVELQIDSNYGNSVATVGEVAFATNGTSVPEPATLALTLAGVAAVAGIRRRRSAPV